MISFLIIFQIISYLVSPVTDVPPSSPLISMFQVVGDRTAGDALTLNPLDVVEAVVNMHFIRFLCTFKPTFVCMFVPG